MSGIHAFRRLIRNLLRHRPALFTCVAAIVFPLHAWAGVLGHAPENDISLWRVAGVLALCLGLAVLAAGALRFRATGNFAVPVLARRNARLKVVESICLANQAELCLVSCDGGELLVLSSPQGGAQAMTPPQIARPSESVA